MDTEYLPTDPRQLRYIVFLLLPEVSQYLSDGRKSETHDGEIFCSLHEAREYALNAIKQNLCTRFVIGVFCINPKAERMGISMVESFGFRNDKKNPAQLYLFST